MTGKPVPLSVSGTVHKEGASGRGLGMPPDPITDSVWQLVGVPSSQLKNEFKVVRDAVTKNKLPNDLKLHDTCQGIQAKDRELAAILSKFGRFTETNLKLIADFNSHKTGIPEEAQDMIRGLCVSFCAQLKYCQDEYAGVVVSGQFGGETKQVFRVLQRNTSAFNDDSLQTLKTAVALTGNLGRAQGERKPDWCSRNQWHGNWHGQHRRGRGFQFAQGDNRQFPQQPGCHMPFQREPDNES